MFLVSAVTRHPALYLARCPAGVRTFHSCQFLGKSATGSVQTDRHGVDADPENRSRFRLAETVPREEPEELLIVGTQSRERLDGRCLNRMDCRGLIGLGAE